MTKMFRSLQSNNRDRNLNLQGGNYAPHNSEEYGSALQYQQSQSSAESTMSWYSNIKPSIQERNSGMGKYEIKVETRLCQSTSNQHPYDRKNDYLSKLPVDFKGCFNCEKTNHFRTGDCRLAQADNFDKKKFFLELWVHKPHKKIRPGHG